MDRERITMLTTSPTMCVLPFPFFFSFLTWHRGGGEIRGRTVAKDVFWREKSYGCDNLCNGSEGKVERGNGRQQKERKGWKKKEKMGQAIFLDQG